MLWVSWNGCILVKCLFWLMNSWFRHRSARINGEGNGTPLQDSCLENPMDRGAWWAAVHGVSKSWTRLSDFTFPFHFQALEEEMATHSSVLAWRIPGTAEPGGLPSMGSHRVSHDWSHLAAAAAARIKALSHALRLKALVCMELFPPGQGVTGIIDNILNWIPKS